MAADALLPQLRGTELGHPAPTWKANSSVSYSDLFRASSLPIRRHVKVQAAATAFDPVYRAYFRELKKARKRANTAERVGSYRPASRIRRQRPPGRVA